ncbi:DNA/RNA nuclease SfsA [Enterococcus diestrammenae]|uniref:DNA/RNA nuclease SfsA n=1 Tax=Enterococcus diestrammenae TaxID=1155073 RepID=UPI0022E4EBC6|nr:DNA/RNA nuclease SfsA [Enterococcus diestrammenae]
MKYENTLTARFIIRENRFIARCRLADGKEVVVHVKNTGRGKELLLPEALVVLQYCPSPTRKTSYDLLAVQKGQQWINIDSQLPNKLALEGLLNQRIDLPGVSGDLTLIKPEVTFEHSKFDLYFETASNQRGFIEVKGMTLENQEIGAFPDAPTLRGQKHVRELTDSRQAGYLSYVLFVIQFQQVQLATIHTAMQPALREAVARAQANGVEVLAYNCQVSPEEVVIDQKIPFELDYPFVDPNEPPASTR